MTASKKAQLTRDTIATPAATKARRAKTAVATKQVRTVEVATSGLVGARLRAQRLSRGISLRQFARDLDVSASFISQLETGKAQPSVATLFAICTALDIATDDLFDGTPSSSSPADLTGARQSTDASNNAWQVTSAPSPTPRSPAPGPLATVNGPSPVVRPGERNVLVLDSGVTWELLTATHSDKSHFMYVRYDVGGSSTMEGRLIRHVGSEYGFILHGTLEVTLGFERYQLNAGDSISFDSTLPHRLTNVGDVPVEAIWFNLERFDDTH